MLRRSSNKAKKRLQQIVSGTATATTTATTGTTATTTAVVTPAAPGTISSNTAGREQKVTRSKSLKRPSELGSTKETSSTKEEFANLPKTKEIVAVGWNDIFTHINDKLLWRKQPTLNDSERVALEKLCSPVLHLLVAEPAVVAKRMKAQAMDLHKEIESLQQLLQLEKQTSASAEQQYKQKIKELHDKLEKLESDQDWTSDLTALTVQLQQSLMQIAELEEDNKKLNARLQQTLEFQQAGSNSMMMLDQLRQVTSLLHETTSEKFKLLTKIEALEKKLSNLEKASFEDLTVMINTNTTPVNSNFLDMLFALTMAQRTTPVSLDQQTPQ